MSVKDRRIMASFTVMPNNQGWMRNIFYEVFTEKGNIAIECCAIFKYVSLSLSLSLLIFSKTRAMPRL